MNETSINLKQYPKTRFIITILLMLLLTVFLVVVAFFISFFPATYEAIVATLLVFTTRQK